MRGVSFDRVLFWLHGAAAFAVIGFCIWQDVHHRPSGRFFAVAMIGLTGFSLLRDHLRKARQRSEHLQEPFL